MKFDKILFVLLMCSVTSYAGAYSVSDSVKTVWGKPSISKCNSHEGDVADFCQSVTDNGAVDADRCAAKKPMGMHLYVATSINENGARFCPVYALSYRADGSGKPETYYAMNKNTDNCFWVCRDGFGGSECGADYKTVAKSCDPVQLTKPIKLLASEWASRKNKESLKYMSGYTEVDPAFFASNTYDCNQKWQGMKSADKNQKHDIVLAVRRFTDDGHGVVAQLLQLRAFDEKGEGKKYAPKRVLLKVADEQQHVLCKDGYKIGSSGDSCVPIDNMLCQNIKPCDGWVPDNFPLEKYKVFVPTTENADDTKCYEYRCKESGYAFREDPDNPSVADYECIECTGDGVQITASGYCFVQKPVDNLTGQYETVTFDGEVKTVVMPSVTLQQMKDAKGADGKLCWQDRFESTDDFRECMREYFKKINVIQ